MREIRPSGSEGGVGLIPHPYPYRGHRPTQVPMAAVDKGSFGRGWQMAP